MKLKKSNLVKGFIFLFLAIITILCGLQYESLINYIILMCSACYIVSSIFYFIDFILDFRCWNRNRKHIGYYPEKKIKF